MIVIAMKGERFVIIPSPQGYSVWGKGTAGNITLKDKPVDSMMLDCIGHYPTFKRCIYVIGEIMGEDFKNA
jgi:hypothetical protein